MLFYLIGIACAGVVGFVAGRRTTWLSALQPSADTSAAWQKTAVEKANAETSAAWQKRKE